MLLKEYERLVYSPKKAANFIAKLCWPNYQRFCPSCKSRKFKKLSSQKRKCLRCNTIFTDFTARYFNIVRIKPDDWLRIVKLFEMETRPDEIAHQLGLSYNTIRKALTSIRLAILANSLDGSSLIKHFNLYSFPSKKKAKIQNPPVFGLIEQEKHVFIDFLPDLDLESFVHLKLNFKLPSKKIGQIIYTAPVRQYLSLLVYDHKITTTYNLKHQGQYIALDGNKNFWPFAKRRLHSFRTTSELNFLLYFKELEFRYNYKQKDFFLRLLKYLASFIEKP
ncbi:transposase [Desulfonauticus submarinus]